MQLVLFVRLFRGQDTNLLSGNIAVAPVPELISVASRLPDSLAYPGENRSQGSARFFPGQYVAHPETVDDPSTVRDLIEFPAQLLQVALGIPDCLDVSVVVFNLRTKHRIHGSSVREIIGLQHVYKKVNGSTSNLIRFKHFIQRTAVPVEDLLDFC